MTDEQIWDTNPHSLGLNPKVASSLVIYKYWVRSHYPDPHVHGFQAGHYQYTSLVRQHIEDNEMFLSYLFWKIPLAVATLLVICPLLAWLT